MKSKCNSKKHIRFLIKQLVQRDFKARYKKTFLGMLWSMLSPLVLFLAQVVVFTFLFDRGENYITYLIVGNVVFHYFSDATQQGLYVLEANSGIISSVKVKKDIFLLSKNISCLYNFFLTTIIMFAIMLYDGLTFHWIFISLLYPTVCLFFLNFGVGYILSALEVFLKDTQYLYSIFIGWLMWFSAIFYRVDMFPEKYQILFLFNPIYPYIHYFRSVIIDNIIPDIRYSVLCLIYALVFMCIGWVVYRINNNRFIYYL